MQNGASIWIGYDPREVAAFAVTRHSIRRHLTVRLPIRGLVLDDLRQKGLYTRPTERRPGVDGPVLFDVISDHPMATEFAVSRFLVPHLAKTGWALFLDCDMLVRGNLVRLFESLSPSKAVYVVKHDYKPDNKVKMDGQTQSQYNRKLWSAFCIFNCDHPANKELTPELVNSLPGRDLHRFAWLDDEEIGELGEEWQWIPNHSSPDIDPKCVHFTEGGAWFKNYQNIPFAQEWLEELSNWAR